MRQNFVRPIPKGTTLANFRIDAATRARVIDGAIAKLAASYVLTEFAAHMGDTVRARQKRGAYDSVTNGASLAAILTEDLQAVHRDFHLRVVFNPQGVEAVVQTESEPVMRARLRESNCAFEKAEVQAGNVGYIKLNGLPNAGICSALASTFMNSVASTDALIIDLRDCSGGDPAMETLVLSYLFDKRTHLYDVWIRDPEKTEPYWTRDKVPGKKFGGTKPVYILISPRTFSGGESIAYTLQQQKRATIVGEQTAGGANGVSAVPVDDRFRVLLPFARKIDAVSKSNWEQVGITPDIRVPSVVAFDTARALIARRAKR